MSFQRFCMLTLLFRFDLSLAFEIWEATLDKHKLPVAWKAQGVLLWKNDFEISPTHET